MKSSKIWDVFAMFGVVLFTTCLVSSNLFADDPPNGWDDGEASGSNSSASCVFLTNNCSGITSCTVITDPSLVNGCMTGIETNYAKLLYNRPIGICTSNSTNNLCLFYNPVHCAYLTLYLDSGCTLNLCDILITRSDANYCINPPLPGGG